MNKHKQRYILQAWLLACTLIVLQIALRIVWASDAVDIDLDLSTIESVESVVETEISESFISETSVDVEISDPVEPLSCDMETSGVECTLPKVEITPNSSSETEQTGVTYPTEQTGETYPLESMPDEYTTELNVCDAAGALGITEQEFELFSRVVEAESNRDPEDITGRLYIAATIWNRMDDERFPSTINSVLCQSGQFSTVHSGTCYTSPSALSQWAIVQSRQMIDSGEIPNNILFFNCVGYNAGTPFDRIGGNYFMCY